VEASGKLVNSPSIPYCINLAAMDGGVNGARGSLRVVPTAGNGRVGLQVVALLDRGCGARRVGLLVVSIIVVGHRSLLSW
jgi:hypothetical protein